MSQRDRKSKNDIYWNNKFLTTVPGNFDFNKVDKIEKFSRRYEETMYMRDIMDFFTDEIVGRTVYSRSRAYYMASRWVNRLDCHLASR